MRFFLLFLIIISNLNNSYATTLSPEKILLIKVNESGSVSIGRDTILADELARYVQYRLFKSCTGSGQALDKIKLEKTSTRVPDMVTEVVIAEIQAGQRRALTELCLLKYKKLFDHIGQSKQDKLKKKFPVLFQIE